MLFLEINLKTIVAVELDCESCLSGTVNNLSVQMGIHSPPGPQSIPDPYSPALEAMLLKKEEIKLSDRRFGSLLSKFGKRTDLSVALCRLPILRVCPSQERSRQTVAALAFFDRFQERYCVGAVSREQRGFRRQFRHYALPWSILRDLRQESAKLAKRVGIVTRREHVLRLQESLLLALIELPKRAGSLFATCGWSLRGQ